MNEQLPNFDGIAPMFVFDLDSTITRCELLPLLAREAGIEAEMAQRTERCMRGETPFEADFPARVDLLRNLPLKRAQKAAASAPVNPKIACFLRAHAGRSMILTGNLDVWIAPILERLGMSGRCLCSVARLEGEYVRGIQTLLADKGAAARTLPHPFVAIGDGSNDAGMLRASDYGIAFGGVRTLGAEILAAADRVVESEAELCCLLERLA